jgi:hypothetical protein
MPDQLCQMPDLMPVLQLQMPVLQLQHFGSLHNRIIYYIPLIILDNILIIIKKPAVRLAIFYCNFEKLLATQKANGRKKRTAYFTSTIFGGGFSSTILRKSDLE